MSTAFEARGGWGQTPPTTPPRYGEYVGYTFNAPVPAQYPQHLQHGVIDLAARGFVREDMVGGPYHHFLANYNEYVRACKASGLMMHEIVLAPPGTMVRPEAGHIVNSGVDNIINPVRPGAPVYQRWIVEYQNGSWYHHIVPQAPVLQQPLGWGPPPAPYPAGYALPHQLQQPFARPMEYGPDASAFGHQNAIPPYASGEAAGLSANGGMPTLNPSAQVWNPPRRIQPIGFGRPDAVKFNLVDYDQTEQPSRPSSPAAEISPHTAQPTTPVQTSLGTLPLREQSQNSPVRKQLSTRPAHIDEYRAPPCVKIEAAPSRETRLGYALTTEENDVFGGTFSQRAGASPAPVGAAPNTSASTVKATNSPLSANSTSIVVPSAAPRNLKVQPKAGKDPAPVEQDVKKKPASGKSTVLKAKRTRHPETPKAAWSKKRREMDEQYRLAISKRDKGFNSRLNALKKSAKPDELEQLERELREEQRTEQKRDAVLFNDARKAIREEETAKAASNAATPLPKAAKVPKQKTWARIVAEPPVPEPQPAAVISGDTSKAAKPAKKSTENAEEALESIQKGKGRVVGNRSMTVSEMKTSEPDVPGHHVCNAHCRHRMSVDRLFAAVDMSKKSPGPQRQTVKPLQNAGPLVCSSGQWSPEDEIAGNDEVAVQAGPSSIEEGSNKTDEIPISTDLSARRPSSVSTIRQSNFQMPDQALMSGDVSTQPSGDGEFDVEQTLSHSGSSIREPDIPAQDLRVVPPSVLLTSEVEQDSGLTTPDMEASFHTVLEGFATPESFHTPLTHTRSQSTVTASPAKRPETRGSQVERLRGSTSQRGQPVPRLGPQYYPSAVPAARTRREATVPQQYQSHPQMQTVPQHQADPVFVRQGDEAVLQGQAPTQTEQPKSGGHRGRGKRGGRGGRGIYWLRGNGRGGSGASSGAAAGA